MQPASDLFLKVLEGHRQWPSVKAVCERLKTAGFDAVLAGGCVRDGLLGVTPKDFDVATSATPDQVEAVFEKTIAVGKNFGVIMVPLSKDSGADGTIEVATFRKDGDYKDGRRPSEVVFADRRLDAERRDFTVNALFYDPSDNLIIDYTGGRADLAKKILRVVGNPKHRFEEDKLRLLRAVRFRGQLGFEIESETEAAILKFAKDLHVVSRERIRDEIDKMLMSPSAALGFEAMERLKLAETVFSDWHSLIFPVNPHVFSHSDLDVRRMLLLWPALKQSSPERIQQRLQEWKFGRAFIELVLWTRVNENGLRPSSKDPVKTVRAREQIVESFEIELSTPAAVPLGDSEWMDAIELWTNEKAVGAISVLDTLYGRDFRREEALKRRDLILGKIDPQRAASREILEKAEALPPSQAEKVHGPLLGRELKRLNREILLRK